MKASSKRFLSILVAILLFVASIFVYSSLIRPAYTDIKNLRAELESKSDIFTKNDASIKQVKKLLTEYQDITQIQQTISLILPLEQNVSVGVNQINGLARFNNLTVELLSARQLAIKPSAQSDLVRGFGVLRYNFRLSGTYDNFKKFLQAMETNINLMDVVDLKTEATSKGSLSYTMEVNTYYQANK